MPKWEYGSLFFGKIANPEIKQSRTWESFDTSMAEMGQQGWECYAILSGEKFYFTSFHFKRSIK